MKIIYNKPIQFESGLNIYKYNTESQKLEGFYISEKVQAGFPSPAEDFITERLSLDERYISDPDSTYFVRSEGLSMFHTIHPNDLLITKKGIELYHNAVAIVSVNFENYTLKRIDLKRKLLIPDNKDFQPIKLLDDDIVSCFSIVKHIIRDI